MKKATLFIFLFVYFFCSYTAAQEVKEYERLTKFTAASLIYTQYSTNSFESDLVKGKVTTSELKATLQYPLQFKEQGWTIINGLNFILLSPKVEEEVNAIEIKRNFYTIAYHTAIIKDIGKKNWRITAFL